jgi:hypothetical protein
LPLQRWLGGIGAGGGALLGGAGLAVGRPIWLGGVLVLFIFAVFPALFASAAVFRALSAQRANRLLPHFRARMLGAVALLVASFLALVATLLLAPGGATRAAILVYAFAFATAMFVVMFLQFGNWRWMAVWIGGALLLAGLSAAPATRGSLAAIPVWAWLAASAAVWIAFAAWYLRARHIGPLALVPEPPADAWTRTALDGPVTRADALRALVTAQPPRAQPRSVVVPAAVGIVLLASFMLSPLARLVPFTSVVWPFATLMIVWGKSTSIVHRSRLLWLKLPGPRAAVRREIEATLLRNLGGTLLLLLGVAGFYLSPLAAAPPLEVLAGFTLAAGAGLFGVYAALAATPGNIVHYAAFGLLVVVQLALVRPPSPSLTNVVIVVGLELVGATALRAFALARWRRVDWLRLRPLPRSNLFSGA